MMDDNNKIILWVLDGYKSAFSSMPSCRLGRRADLKLAMEESGSMYVPAIVNMRLVRLNVPLLALMGLLRDPALSSEELLALCDAEMWLPLLVREVARLRCLWLVNPFTVLPDPLGDQLSLQRWFVAIAAAAPAAPEECLGSVWEM